jgi:Predicted acetyltransferase
MKPISDSGRTSPARLSAPSTDLKEEFLRLYQDYQKAGESDWCEAANGALRNFSDYIRSLADDANGKGISSDWAPTSHFWLMDQSHLIGTLRIRHYLTPAVEERAGHIGYDISPQYRGKGYGHQIFALGLIEARRMAIREVLAICSQSNLASRRILEKAGGVIKKRKGGDIWYLLKEPTRPQ